MKRKILAALMCITMLPAVSFSAAADEIPEVINLYNLDFENADTSKATSEADAELFTTWLPNGFDASVMTIGNKADTHTYQAVSDTSDSNGSKVLKLTSKASGSSKYLEMYSTGMTSDFPKDDSSKISIGDNGAAVLSFDYYANGAAIIVRPGRALTFQGGTITAENLQHFIFIKSNGVLNLFNTDTEITLPMNDNEWHTFSITVTSDNKYAVVADGEIKIDLTSFTYYTNPFRGWQELRFYNDHAEKKGTAASPFEQYMDNISYTVIRNIDFTSSSFSLTHSDKDIDKYFSLSDNIIYAKPATTISDFVNGLSVKEFNMTGGTVLVLDEAGNDIKDVDGKTMADAKTIKVVTGVLGISKEYTVDTANSQEDNVTVINNGTTDITTDDTNDTLRLVNASVEALDGIGGKATDDKSLKIVPSTTSHGYIDYNIQRDTTYLLKAHMPITLEYSMYASGNTADTALAGIEAISKAGNISIMNMAIGSGKVTDYINKQELGTVYKPNKWNRFAITVYPNSMTYDFYINGVKAHTGVVDTDKASEYIQRFRLRARYADADDLVAYDDVKLTYGAYEYNQEPITLSSSGKFTVDDENITASAATLAETIQFVKDNGYEDARVYADSTLIDQAETLATDNVLVVSDGDGMYGYYTITYEKNKEATPEIVIDYVNEQLTSFGEGNYTIDGNAVTPENGKLAAADYMDSTIAIVKKGNGTTTEDSETQELVVPARPIAPNVTAVQPTAIGDKGSISGLTTAMEYKKSDADAWTACTDNTITNLDAGEYKVRLKAVTEGDKKAFKSAETSVTITAFTATKETTPNIEIDYENENLTGFGEGSYTIDGVSVTPTDGKLAVADYMGKTIAIVKKGNETTTIDSETQSLEIPSRPNMLTGDITVTQPSVIGGTGSIEGIIATMEYSTDNGVSWTDGDGNTISNIAGGTRYLIRIKATNTSFKSENRSVTINTFGAQKETTPNIEINYENEKLTGFGEGNYTIGGVSITPENGELSIAKYINQTLSIVKEGNGTTTTDSEAQELVVPDRPTAPTVTAVQPSFIGGKGSISGVTTAMEYKKSNADAWMDCTDTTITNLDVGEYKVRLKTVTEGEKAFASAEATVTITAFTAEKEATPNIVIDYVNEQLTGFGTGSYTINNTTVTSTDGKLAIADYMGKTILIVKKGNGTTTSDSEAQSLAVPARPSKPSVSGVDPTTINGKGSIIGVTTAMEYKKQGDNAWISVTGTSITNLDVGTYLVRLKVTNSTFTSETETIEIEAFTSGKEATPNIAIDYDKEQLTGFVSQGQYTIKVGAGDSENVTLTDGHLAITADYFGKTISIVKRGNGTTTTDSKAQSLTVPVRPSAPTLTINNATEKVKIPKGYFYGTAGSNYENIANAGNGTDISVNSETSIYIYQAAVTEGDNKSFKSAVQTLTAPERQAKPTVTIDYINETLSTTVAIQYQNNMSWIDCTADMSASAFEWSGTSEKIVKFRTPSDENKYSSEELEVTIPARPTAPNVTAVAETADGANDGKITGVNNTMEYKLAALNSWTKCDGDEVTSLAPGQYNVRVAAVENTSFSSAVAAVVIKSAEEPSLLFQISRSGKWIKYTGVEACTVSIIAAKYTDEGILQKVEIMPHTFEAGETKNSYSISGYENYRIFIWNSIADMQPLAVEETD